MIKPDCGFVGLSRERAGQIKKLDRHWVFLQVNAPLCGEADFSLSKCAGLNVFGEQGRGLQQSMVPTDSLLQGQEETLLTF